MLLDTADSCLVGADPGKHRLLLEQDKEIKKKQQQIEEEQAKDGFAFLLSLGGSSPFGLRKAPCVSYPWYLFT